MADSKRDIAKPPRKKRFSTTRSIRLEMASIYGQWDRGEITDSTDFRATVFCLKAIADVLQLEKGETLEGRMTQIEERLREMGLRQVS